ncbi:MAG: carbohydrate-binding domain-containing protein [Muribaculaceae bacterium]|nr:carbohydrate-binding domain-containing protein [Muribaculaceae bacterium]
MKKFLLPVVVALVGMPTALRADGESFDLVKGNVTYSFGVETAGVMTFANGKKLTIQDVNFNIADITELAVTKTSIADNTVNITFDGNTSRVTIAGNIAQYVSATVAAGHVTVTQSDLVGDNTCGEITYVLSGSSSNGSFTLNGNYKSTIELQGLELTNPAGAALSIVNGKRIELSSKNGTVNTLVDGTTGTQKGCIYCKGHLELKGKGTLNVTGNKSHAICANEYVEMKNCTVNILGSVKDGINCNQYFLIESGTLNVVATGEDGIQVSYKDSKDREAEDTGSLTIAGGTVNIANITATAAKAIKTEGSFIMTDGELVANTSAPGEWDSSKQKTKASACITADANITIGGGSLNLTASGGGGKGISANGNMTINDGNLTIVTSGGVLAYVNGQLNQSYTGNTDRLDSDAKSSPKGAKVDGVVTINGGNIDITTSGNGGEGIESKETLTITGGNIRVRAKDDAINSSSHMYIKGGVIDVISTGNDGLDSNGNIYIEDGIVMAFGAARPECGLDANEEEGYTVYFTGGYILAAGGGNSVPTKSGSTQPFVTTGLTVDANTQVSIKTSSNTLYTFTTPEDLTSVNLGGSTGNRPGGPGGMGSGSSSLLISVPGMTLGTTYTITSGNSSSTATASLTGTSSGPGGRP